MIRQLMKRVPTLVALLSLAAAPAALNAQANCNVWVELDNWYSPFTGTCLGVIATTYVECDDGSSASNSELQEGQPCLE